ncbi:MAG: esterase-like activity of phytase family protein [Burkholderiaceae bacterium]|nr:esterase-like activity of phytase family protein [Burkholderiaceae bacterium]
MKTRFRPLAATAALLLTAGAATAAPSFVNGLTLDGSWLDLSGGSSVNNGRLGYFSDLYYDPNRREWWALSDRGPGGGTLDYDTRLQRFTVDVNQTSGEISNFRLLQTLVFRDGNGLAFNGKAPATGGVLGNSLDPEGLVVNPRNGNFLVSDEYGPSLLEFDRNGRLVRRYTVPDNLVPRVGATVDYLSTPPTLISGREPNRGLEGLAISPDGRYAFAMLQDGTIQDGWTSSGRPLHSRIVKFDTSTGKAVAQYAYRLQGSGQGRGISALVAINDHEFLVLERNNRGVGVPDANLASPDKKVFQIDLSAATDVTGLDLNDAGTGFTAVTKTATPFLDLAAAGTLQAALGNVSPEKWEGLAIGPKLADGSFLMLAGTDNDYSVTQNGTGTQFDVYIKPGAGTVSRIQCDIGTYDHCITVNSNGSLGPAVAPGFDTTGYTLLPAVLNAYKVSAGDLPGYLAPVPEPGTWALMAGGLVGLGALSRRRAKPAG